MSDELQTTARQHLLALILLLLPAMASTQTGHSLADIEREAGAFARRHFSNQPGNLSVRAGPLDRRLRLAACAEPLQLFLPPGSDRNNISTIGVACRSPQYWKIFVPVRVLITGHVLVAREPLPRGVAITAEQVALEERELRRLPYGYLKNVAQLEGKRTSRPVAPGTVLTPLMLDRQLVIRKGQTVTLLAKRSGVDIRMRGRALSDGSEGDRIQVQNMSSNRTIEGIVRSPQVVEVLLN